MTGRVTLAQAERFAKESGIMLTVKAVEYLELADGDEELARKIAEYKRGDGYEKPITIGHLIREHWQGASRKDGKDGRS